MGYTRNDHVSMLTLRPWSRKLLKGEKTVECRSYALPPELLGKPLEIIETRAGDTVSGLGDHIGQAEGDDEPEEAVYLMGTVVFSECKEYKSMAEWRGDSELHCVSEASIFAFEEGKPCFGWVVQSQELFDLPQRVPPATRKLRSLFTVDPAPK